MSAASDTYIDWIAILIWVFKMTEAGWRKYSHGHSTTKNNFSSSEKLKKILLFKTNERKLSFCKVLPPLNL